jgi:carbon-monoxide dehydrogenase large subunit
MNDMSKPADLAARFGTGQPVRRIEDPALVTGRGRYTDDITLPGLTHLMFLRSPHAHARIVSIDTRAAAALPGVVAIHTGEELRRAGVKPLPMTTAFKRPDGKPGTAPPLPALAYDVVRFVGQPVAAVVAATRAQARDAIDAIEIEYDPLPAVGTIEAALAPGAATVWADAPDNIACEARHGDAKAAADAFARAAHTVSLDLVNQRLAGAQLEPRVVLADHETASGRLIVRISSQMPTAVRGTLAECLGLPLERVRVLVSDVGGGFGIKTGGYIEDVVVGYAARALKRPVKWCSDRSEDFLASRHGRDIVSRAELALDAHGKVLALRVKTDANVGSCPGGTGIAIQLLIGPWVSTSIYDIDLIDLHLRAVLTHAAPTGPYRGAGRPEAIYIIERLFDAAARKMGVDPAELRRRNVLPPERFPHKNPMGQVYDVGNFGHVLESGLKQADWNGFDARAKASSARGRLRGRGMASFLEWTSGNAFEESVTVTVKPEGEIEIVSATMPMGQGIATSYVQLAVEVFGVPMEKIRIVQGDTDRANGFGSAGSRSLFTGGSAVRSGAVQTVERGKLLAADALEAAAGDIEYQAGVFRVAGTDLKIDLFQLAGRQPDRRFVVDATTTASGPTWPSGCHVCEVEVDPQTGEVAIASYSSVNDVGTVVNPMIVTGQIDGGAVQGIGQALTEQMVYDAESAQLLTASFMDYAMPRADLVGKFVTSTDQSTPSKNNMLGVKGVGELGTIGATPAVVNAVVDALLRAGVSADRAYALQMPLTSARVWQALTAGASR